MHFSFDSLISALYISIMAIDGCADLRKGRMTMNATKEATEAKWVKASSLRIGDTIAVWWSPNRDTITRLEKYEGPLAHLWPDRARIAYFAINQSGMTLPNGDYEQLIGRIR